MVGPLESRGDVCPIDGHKAPSFHPSNAARFAVLRLPVRCPLGGKPGEGENEEELSHAHNTEGTHDRWARFCSIWKS